MKIPKRFMHVEPVAVDTHVLDDHPEVPYWVGIVAEYGNSLLDNEFKAVRQLRARSYISLGYLTALEVEDDGGESDKEDERAVQLAVIERRVGSTCIIGTARLILKQNANDLLPVERFFQDVFEDEPAPIASLEASRFIADHYDFRVQHAVSLVLMLTMGVYAHVMSAPYIYATMEESLARYFQRTGVPLVRLTEKKKLAEYGNSENLAARFQPRDVIAAIRTLSPNDRNSSKFLERAVKALSSEQHNHLLECPTSELPH